MPATFAAPEIFGMVDFFGLPRVFTARTGADFFVAWREADLRDAAARVVDLRTV
jgi:hypothetical protein